MNGYNRVTLAGNLTRNPELRHTANGTAVANIGLAVNRVWYDSEGEKKEDTTFVDVTAWGKQAETIAQHCRKGRPLLIEGRLQLETWETPDHEKRSRMIVVLESFVFLNEGQKNEQNGGRTR